MWNLLKYLLKTAISLLFSCLDHKRPGPKPLDSDSSALDCKPVPDRVMVSLNLTSSPSFIPCSQSTTCCRTAEPALQLLKVDWKSPVSSCGSGSGLTFTCLQLLSEYVELSSSCDRPEPPGSVHTDTLTVYCTVKVRVPDAHRHTERLCCGEAESYLQVLFCSVRFGAGVSVCVWLWLGAVSVQHFITCSTLFPFCRHWRMWKHPEWTNLNLFLHSFASVVAQRPHIVFCFSGRCMNPEPGEFSATRHKKWTWWTPN